MARPNESTARKAERAGESAGDGSSERQVSDAAWLGRGSGVDETEL